MSLVGLMIILMCVRRIPGKLRQFVLDLHSGKLHREFHHGPDPTDSTPGQVRTPHKHTSTPSLCVYKTVSLQSYRELCVCVYINVLFHQEINEVASNPPESSFQKLAPSETRYTLLRDRDELWPQRLYHKPDLWPTTPWHAPESVSRVRTGQRDGTATPQLTPNTLNGEREEEERIRKTRE